MTVKRVFDFTASVLGLIILSPLLLIVAAGIFFTMGGPIFFIQRRPGYKGKLFNIIKFRTMKGSEKDGDDSVRLTSFGKFLRATSLDEFPELINVIKGEMSLVGPRPLLEEYLEKYTPEQMKRHDVLPGITGLAQISGRNTLKWDEKFKYDLEYVQNHNFLMDIKILFKTVLKVIFKEDINHSEGTTMPKFNGKEINIKMASADINQADIDAVTEVVKSGWLALGPKTKEFEEKMAEYVGVKHAIAVNSGTSALHLINLALGIGPGDEVLVPSYTFVATVNSILFTGATPIFVDIEDKYYGIDPDKVEQYITPKTKAIMAVDVFGHPADWKALEKIAKKHNLKLIDDSCEALGTIYQGKKIGAWADAACFAFYPNKIMTTGEGGIIVTDSDEIATKCRAYRNQGREEMSQWLEHKYLGFNFRIDEMSSALGVTQLSRIEEFVEKRQKVADYYNSKLKNNSYVTLQNISEGVRMSWFVYVIRLQNGIDRDEVIKMLNERGVPARAYFVAIHTQPYLKEIVAKQKIDLTVTDQLQHETLALPFHNNMTEDEVSFVVENLEEILAELGQKQIAA